MTLRYVAPGDWYTIGTSVARRDAWPERLVEVLGAGTDACCPACLALAVLAPAAIRADAA
jgi:hypothetical protein